MYKAVARPHLEQCIQAWRPYRKKYIDTLERIQRRATKIIPELRDISCEEHSLVNKCMSTHLKANANISLESNANANAIFQERIQMQMQMFWLHICTFI